MKSLRRVLAVVPAACLGVTGVAFVASPAHAAQSNLQITEIAYGGKGDKSPGLYTEGDGEYVEVTNVGDAPQDLTGWSYAANKSATTPTAGVVDLSSLGTIAPGESFVITDLTAAHFRAEWGLKSSVKVINDGATTISSSATSIAVFNGSTLVDSLGWAAGYLPAKGVAAYVNAGHLGDTDTATAGAWTTPATAGDAESSWTSAGGSIGSPGASTLGTSTPASVRPAPDLQITEIAYGGKGDKAPGLYTEGDGEYVEVTNVGDASQSLTGWSYAANKTTTTPTAGVVDLSSLGTIAAGESFVITDLTADHFRAEWGLNASVKVINDGATTISSSVTRVAIFNGTTLVDSLGWAAGYLSAKGVGAFVNAGHLADTDTATSGVWTTPTTTTDAEGSWTSAGGSIGSPGASTLGTSTPASVRATTGGEDAHSVVKIASVDRTAGSVTLTNNGTAAHDISGWTVQNTAGVVITVPASTTLAAGASQTFTATTNTFAATDFAKLYDAGTLVDTSTWAGVDPNWADVSINEVSSDNAVVVAGVTLRDPVELYNKGVSAVSIAGWKTADSGHLAALADLGPIYVNGSSTPASSAVIPAKGFAVFHSPNGLSGEGDEIQLYLPDNTLVSSIAYPTSVAGTDNGGPYTSVAACPDGSTSYLKVKAASFGASNATACATGEALDAGLPPTTDVDCTTEAPAATTDPVDGALAWPGSASVSVADDVCAWDGGGTQQDVSGLVFDPTDPSILWAVKNKSVVYKLTKSNGVWQKVTTNGWANGKAITFPGGTGLPDSEGMTVGPDGALYVTTERDNANNAVPLDSILRFDPTGSATTLVATDQWDLTSDVFPARASADANLGFEGVTYVPDSYLTDNGFIDDNTHTAYTPSTYPKKLTAGLFLGAVEKTGHLVAYALNADHTFSRVAEIATGMDGVMDVAYDADLHRVWAQCDNTCGVTLSLLEIGSDGHFTTEKQFARPEGLPDNNLEGFAVAPVSTAVGGRRETVWSDDGNFGTSSTGVSLLADDGGHSLWSGLMDVDLDLGPQGYDATPPVIVTHADPAPNTAGWNNGTVTVTYTCTDAGWGVDTDASDLAADVLSTSGTATATCTDLAGNTATASYTTQIDDIAPVASAISIAGPASVDTGAVSFAIASTEADVVSFRCRLVGVDAGFTACTSADGYAAGGLPIGTYTLQVEAVDRAGNVSQPASRSFAVVAKAVAVTPAAPVIHSVTGKPKVGKKVKVAVTAPSGATVTYQWFAGSKKIKGAHKSSLKVTKALRHKRLKVKVVVSVPGQAPVTKTVKVPGKVG